MRRHLRAIFFSAQTVNELVFGQREGPGLAYSPMSPDPGILGRLSVDSSGGSRNPAHEQSDNDKRTRKSFAENTVASLMLMIRWRRSPGCSLSVNPRHYLTCIVPSRATRSATPVANSRLTEIATITSPTYVEDALAAVVKNSFHA